MADATETTDAQLMDDRFNRRASLITGAGSGIGRALAMAFAAAGARVVVADIDAVGADDTATEIGDSAIRVSVDISDEASAAKLVQRAVDVFGRIDMLCNNAGIPGPISLPAEISKLVTTWRSASNPRYRKEIETRISFLSIRV
jgi:NAD(P)-dependent dehydrogenase (short-subunit alcohol dehydrogenase family)